MIIREETPADVDVIRRLTEEAFATMAYSDGTEPAIIERLRAAGALTFSLVAEEGGKVVGHVAFSPVTIAVPGMGQANDGRANDGRAGHGQVSADHGHGHGHQGILEDGWYGLGPISVWPARQRAGIGSALVREGLSRLRGIGAKGCVLAGDPGYYARFGFATDPAFASPGIPHEYFMRVALSPVYAGGTVTYHPAFYG